MKNREHRFLTEKHPFINDAENAKYEHEVALTMDHHVSGNTYGFHANRINKQKYYSSRRVTVMIFSAF